jgi:hypothetical protein
VPVALVRCRAAPTRPMLAALPHCARPMLAAWPSGCLAAVESERCAWRLRILGLWCRRRCGGAETNPGADVGGAETNPGVDVAGVG